MAQLLLEHGADPKAVSQRGETPYLWAKHNGHEDVAQLLVEAMLKAASEAGPIRRSLAMCSCQTVTFSTPSISAEALGRARVEHSKFCVQRK